MHTENIPQNYCGVDDVLVWVWVCVCVARSHSIDEFEYKTHNKTIISLNEPIK